MVNKYFCARKRAQFFYFLYNNHTMIKKILVLSTLLTIAFVITNRTIHSPIVQEDTALTPNEKIIKAFSDFETFANTKPTVAAETLCQGGFINPTRSELKKVVNTIIKNRSAKNQDEAGITCLSLANTWVLFSALNNNEYYCIDSTGTKGKLGFDRKKMTCTSTI